MDGWVAVGAVLSGGFAIVIGYFYGRSTDSPNTTIPTVSSTLTSCDDACAQWDMARQANCLAQAALAAANTALSSLNSQLTVAWAIAAAFWAAVIAAAVLPAVGWIVAAAIAVVASGATAYALYLSGLTIAASGDQSSKQATALAAVKAVLDARNVVLAVCKGDAATACLSRPSPCG